MQKCFGILLAFAGCTIITTMTMTNADETRSTSSWVGHPLFLLNCCGTPLQLLAMKPLLKRYATPLVTGYAFMVSAALFLASTWAFSRNQRLLDFVCPPDTQPCGDGWQFPREAAWALGYYTIFGSLVSCE